MNQTIIDLALRWFKENELPVREVKGTFFYVTPKGYLLELSTLEVLDRANKQKNYEERN